MWFSNALLRPALVAILLAGSAVLSACSFTPVYSGAMASQPRLDIAYAKPNSRLEQVIYQELALRLGDSTSAIAGQATLRVATNFPDISQSRNVNPRKPELVLLTATLSIAYPEGSGVPPLKITRRATANFTRTGQILADNAAAEDAGERAAKAAAESLRLAVLAELSRG